MYYNFWKTCLWSKDFKWGINGKCYNATENAYKGIKAIIAANVSLSDSFIIGVRQGPNL